MPPSAPLLQSDDFFDKSFFNVEGSSVQPILKKVDPGSMAEAAGLVPGDVILSVNGITGLSNFQVVEMLRKGQGVFNLIAISGRQIGADVEAAELTLAAAEQEAEMAAQVRATMDSHRRASRG